MTLQAFGLIFCENNWKRLECHTFLAKKHEKVWHSKRFDWFYVKIIENAWGVTLFLLKTLKSLTLQAFWLILGESHWKRLVRHTFLAKKHEKGVTLQAFFADFRWKSLKCLECHTFLAKKHEKCDTPSVLTDFRWKSLFYLSETQLFPTPAFPGKMVPELALRPSLPRAPGVRMTWV